MHLKIMPSMYIHNYICAGVCNVSTKLNTMLEILYAHVRRPIPHFGLCSNYEASQLSKRYRTLQQLCHAHSAALVFSPSKQHHSPPRVLWKQAEPKYRLFIAILKHTISPNDHATVL